VVYAEVLQSGEKIKPQEELFYYWYSANDIKKNRGDYEGKLLHGRYTSYYYPDKNLREKGVFQYGLKTGIWKGWHANGEIHEITRWKHGQKRGRFRVFDQEGRLIRTGKYTRDQLHGKVKIYHSGDSTETQKFRYGKRILKKQRKRLSKQTTTDSLQVKQPSFIGKKKTQKRGEGLTENTTEKVGTSADNIETSEGDKKKKERKRQQPQTGKKEKRKTDPDATQQLPAGEENNKIPGKQKNRN
jgi:hypothetical protein